ncbi:sushi, von Willebrand factor type A, EGF and pentraxin domain-containing protein 1-like [Haliotis rufescens]|uniref:sushi, von Willebrand factor type A, EGF and pentraxin domain-containing protein 1-like n=1 Tax=Haliotis rufescens TaxID=6454 RepID=UPI00201F6319|nr:sushi, von Willebrand factor type A, EGF and pentraxin domain-containing protein 1-like [Haliotis rufescens]
MEKVPIILLLLLLICHSCFSQDPCENFTELVNIEVRQPNDIGWLDTDDTQLQPGWYAAPVKWKLLSRDTGKGFTCNTINPIYRKSKSGDTSVVCVRSNRDKCFKSFSIETRMCGDREIYNLTTSVSQSGFCFDITDCERYKPCANGGTCTEIWNGYSCACPPQFSGANCTVSIDQKLDILIVEDVSRSIGKPNFDEMKRFQESMVNSTNIGPDAVNVALIAFSSKARVVFRFNEHSNNKSGVLAALKQQTYEEGPSTNIGDAIKLATSTISNGDRNDADNKVIMLTDGYTTIEDREAIAASIGSLKAKAEVFVVAISEVDANSTINLIASRPSNIFKIGSPDAVSAILQKMKGGPDLT